MLRAAAVATAGSWVYNARIMNDLLPETTDRLPITDTPETEGPSDFLGTDYDGVTAQDAADGTDDIEDGLPAEFADEAPSPSGEVETRRPTAVTSVTERPLESVAAAEVVPTEKPAPLEGDVMPAAADLIQVRHDERGRTYMTVGETTFEVTNPAFARAADARPNEARQEASPMYDTLARRVVPGSASAKGAEQSPVIREVREPKTVRAWVGRALWSLVTHALFIAADDRDRQNSLQTTTHLGAPEPGTQAWREMRERGHVLRREQAPAQAERQVHTGEVLAPKDADPIPDGMTERASGLLVPEHLGAAAGAGAGVVGEAVGRLWLPGQNEGEGLLGRILERGPSVGLPFGPGDEEGLLDAIRKLARG